MQTYFIEFLNIVCKGCFKNAINVSLIKIQTPLSDVNVEFVFSVSVSSLKRLQGGDEAGGPGPS